MLAHINHTDNKCFGKAISLRKWQRSAAAHGSDTYIQHKIYIYYISLALYVCVYILCVMHTAILCVNVEIDTNQFQRKLYTTSFSCALFFFFFLSSPHIYRHKHISVSVSHLLDFKIERDWTNFETLSKRSYHKIYATVRVCRMYISYRPKTESLRIVHTIMYVCVYESNITTASSFATMYTFFLFLSPTLSIALCALFPLNDHYVSFSFIHFMLFILWSINRDKKLRSSLLWYYFCPIMDFNRTLVWIKCHLQNVSMDWTSWRQR